MKLNVIIEKGKDGTYDAVMEYSEKVPFGLIGQGNSIEEAIADLHNTREEMRALYKDKNKAFPEDLEFNIKYDVPSFLSYYNQYITLSGLGKLTGINKAQLSQYIQGYRTPSPRTTEKIQTALGKFADELKSIRLL